MDEAGKSLREMLCRRGMAAWLETLDMALSAARDAALEEAAQLMDEAQGLAVAAADREERAAKERVNGRHNDHFVREMRHSSAVLETQAHRIRALKSRPAERYLPEAKVREVLGRIYETSQQARNGIEDTRGARYAEHAGRMGVVFAAARDLGVDLDAKGECDHHRNPDCRHTADEIFQGKP